MDLNQEMNPPAIHGEAKAGESAKLRQQLMMLKQNIDEDTFDLAFALYRAKIGGAYREWGFKSIVEYGREELDLKARRTQYLVRIAEVTTALEIPRNTFEAVGVSKMRVICRLDPAGTFYNEKDKVNEPLSQHIQWLMRASHTTTVAKLNLEVDRLMGMTGGNRMTPRTFAFTEDAWAVIEEAVEKTRKIMGSSGKDLEGIATEYSVAKCVEMWAANFLADPNFDDEPVHIPVEPDLGNVYGDVPVEPTI